MQADSPVRSACGGIASLSMSAFIERYGGAWEDVLASANNTNLLLTLDWLQCWWQHFGIEGCERILAYERAGDRGFFFTAHVPERYYGLPVRTIRCWANSHSQRAGLLPAADAREFADALVEHWFARRGEWDMARLQGIEADSGLAAALVEAARRRGGEARIERAWANHHVPLDRPWQVYYRALSRNSREKGERLGRRLAEQGMCEWRQASGVDEVTQAIEQYFAIEEQSWKAQSGEVIARHRVLHDFYRSAFLALARRGRCEVHLLLLDGQPISAIVAAIYANRKCVYKTSYAEAYAKYSPGWLVYRHLLQDAFGRGFEEVDLFGCTRFTESWSDRSRGFHDVLLVSPTWRGRLIGASKRIKERLHKRLKRGTAP